VVRIESAPVQFPQGKRPARAAVAVGKRVNGLEPVMHDGGSVKRR